MFRICMENMSKQLPFYKEALIKAVSMISKVIDHPNLENKLNNILDMLSGINTSLFGRSEERVTTVIIFVSVIFILTIFFFSTLKKS